VPIAIETDLRIIQDCLMEALNKIRTLSYLIPPVAMVADVALKRFRVGTDRDSLLPLLR
jgi:hypothetical protein